MIEQPEPPTTSDTTGDQPLALNLEAVERRLAGAVSQYKAATERIRSLERQLELTKQALQKAGISKRKLTEREHYKSLLHRLRKRWYLRPFIPQQALEIPEEKAAISQIASISIPSKGWQFRGPHFDPTSSQGRHRILVIGHELNEHLFGGERSLIDVIAAIDPQQFDVFVAFPQKNRHVFAMIEECVQGICVIPYRRRSKDRPIQEKTVARFEQLYREQAIDLVHANTITLSEPLVAAKRAGIPAIVHAREIISQDSVLSSKLGASPDEIVKAVCEDATYLLANSATTLASYPCGDRGGYIHNSVDPVAFDFPNPVDPAAIKVGLISSNIPKKGIFDFVELARMAEEHLPHLQFHLIGPMTKAISQLQTGSPALPGNLHLRGYYSEAPAAHRDLNIVLNLSHCAESFGRTVAEAMAARRPVIAYRYGALPELIRDGVTGLLVPYQDIAAVLDRLRFFAQNPDQIAVFGERAREEAIVRFSPELFSARLNALYGRLISGARSHAGE